MQYEFLPVYHDVARAALVNADIQVNELVASRLSPNLTRAGVDEQYNAKYNMLSRRAATLRKELEGIYHAVV